MSQALTFRPYTPAEREACVAVCRSVVPTYVAPQEVEDFERFLDTLEVYGCRYGVVCRGEGPVIAVGGLGVEGEVATLCWGLVHTDHHKTGVGRWMLETRLGWAREDPKVTRVELCTTQHTYGFFARFGFEVDRTQKDHFAPGLDRYDMVLHTRPAKTEPP